MHVVLICACERTVVTPQPHIYAVFSRANVKHKAELSPLYVIDISKRGSVPPPAQAHFISRSILKH
jgi:hypothetical protein